MLKRRTLRTGFAVALWAATLAMLPCVQPVAAQDFTARDFWSPRNGRLARLEPGTYITVRTTQTIDSNRSDGRVYAGIVNEDVWDDYRRLALPAIPRGSRVELMVRTARDGDLILDLESVFVRGERYEIDAAPTRVESSGRRPSGGDRGEFVGGGAVIGSIIGAIAGGGKGAAIGAAAGAATGLGLSYRGHSVRVPAQSVLTFRLDEGLVLSGRSRHRR
jgi:hypothetical protein